MSLNKVIEWNPAQSNQFAVGCSGKLELMEIQNDEVQTINFKDIYTHPHAIQQVACTCLNWHPDIYLNKSLISYATSIGQVSLLSWQTKEDVYFIKLYSLFL